ncbi:unnamed protein product [Heligmosomoides polygyrus]|uniref:Protein-serine/threonine phosphatase n=1 Tax=Heligmosomoides polygyrus TaxID=6339 RepID=A0A183G4R9_HELPZ|nr:unnamed protein product [Heligmosomoides polygyrus]
MGSALLNNVHRKDLVIRQVGNKDVDKQTVLSLSGRARYHNAAFDALVTGEVFLRLAYLYGERLYRCSPPLEKPISIGIIDSKCCNMVIAELIWVDFLCELLYLLELFKSEEPIFVSHSLCPYTCVAVYFANIGRQALLGQENSKKNRNYLTPQTPRNFPMDLTQQNENHVM